MSRRLTEASFRTLSLFGVKGHKKRFEKKVVYLRLGTGNLIFPCWRSVPWAQASLGKCLYVSKCEKMKNVAHNRELDIGPTPLLMVNYPCTRHETRHLSTSHTHNAQQRRNKCHDDLSLNNALPCSTQMPI